MRLITQLTVLLLLAVFSLPAAALDDAHWKKANASIDKGIEFLRSTQGDDGAWMPEVGPAVTGLVLTALLRQPDIGPDDPQAAKAIRYILDRAQEDGSIRNGPEGILASYNTALCLSALARVGNDPEVAQAIRKGQDFLKGTQWILGMKDPDGNVIDEKHPYFGGFGYGNKGRPDISNTQIALQALHDTGVDCNDPAFQRALTFLNRLQATEENDLYKDQLAELDGGFIYSTTINKDHIGTPESKASQDQIDEGNAGRPVSGLRTYGSVTYAGFKSLIYADLDRDDHRVQSALSWISKNYELEQNPGMPEAQKLQGLYYYYLAKARAMNAFGNSTIEVRAERKSAIIYGHPDAKVSDSLAKINELQEQGIDNVKLGAVGQDGKIEGLDRPLNAGEIYVQYKDGVEQRDWANDLIATIASLQHEKGYWANTESRWLESQPDLVTAYSVLALQNAID